ncbi:hypothetical protein Tco_1127184 [Tanacetum coccineum]
MSDDKTPPAANGAAATDADVNITAPEEDHPDSAVVPKLRSKIQLLEQDLVNGKLKIKHLEDEISSHESDKRALTSIAARASELETQFSSLQHDLISSASDLKRKVIEFEAKERENVEKMSVIEFERNLLLEMLKESEEKMREFQTGKAHEIEVLVERLKECEAEQRKNSDRISKLEARDQARDRELADEFSELEAIERRIEDNLSDLEEQDRKIADMLSESEAIERKVADELSKLEARDRELADELSCLEAIEREKCELEAREREKRIKLIN